MNSHRLRADPICKVPELLAALLAQRACVCLGEPRLDALEAERVRAIETAFGLGVHRVLAHRARGDRHLRAERVLSIPDLLRDAAHVLRDSSLRLLRPALEGVMAGREPRRGGGASRVARDAARARGEIGRRTAW